MSSYRGGLPQLSGDLYLADAGIETDLIFNHDIEIREFASHTLLPKPVERQVMANYFGDFLSLANHHDAGFILERMPWLNIFGGCCGSDLRHVIQIAMAVSKQGKK